MQHNTVTAECTILDQISSVTERLSLIKMRESCPTWKSPEGHVHSTNVLHAMFLHFNLDFFLKTIFFADTVWG